MYEIDEVFRDPHVVSSGILYEMRHERLGKIWQILLPVLFDRERVVPERPPPLLGQHTIEILRELGYTDERIRELVEKRVVATPPTPTV